MASFAVKGMCIQSAGATNEIRLDVEKVEKRQSDQAKTIGSGMLLPKLSSPRLVCDKFNLYFGFFFFFFFFFVL
jgi:hypothetical protein